MSLNHFFLDLIYNKKKSYGSIMRLEQAYFSEQNHYDTLKISPDATCLEVEAAYMSLAKELDLQHPVQSQRALAAEKMLQLTQAYEILNNPIQRSQYDIHTYGREELPVSPQVGELFREAMTAFRKRKSDLALRYFKELTKLYPHRSLYRVHLAISYADKKWLTFSEVELETALRLDPKDEFAKETVAKLLFKLPDRTNRTTFRMVGLNQQVVMLTLAVCFVGIALASGIPQAALSRFARTLVPYEKKELNADALPQDMVKELRQKQSNVKSSLSSVVIPKFGADYVPEKPVYDYTKLTATQKTFYADQNMVVVTYQDGSILTYKPQELKGWKVQGDLPVMITRDHEMIPSPTLPLMLADGTPADLSAASFPSNLFPEYGTGDAPATNATPPSESVETQPRVTPPPVSAPQTVESAPARPQTASTPEAYSPYNTNPGGL